MKPTDGPLFDAGWRRSCRVEQVRVSDVDDFVRAHYLGRRPAIVLLALAMMRGTRRLGCVIYSAPSRETDVRYGGKTWELARLYILDEVPHNAESWLISQSVRWIKRHRPDVCNLVSYADPSAGHAGTIYRAANWRCDGRTDDERKTPRCDYYDARTGKKYGRRGNMPLNAVVERRPRVSKARFFLQLRAPVAREEGAKHVEG